MIGLVTGGRAGVVSTFIEPPVPLPPLPTGFLALVPDYQIRWRNFSEITPLMSYDYDMQLLHTIQVYDSLFRIETSGDETWYFLNKRAMVLRSNGRIELGKLTNRTSNIFPRIEIVRTTTDTPKVIATLLDGGVLIVPDANERPLAVTRDAMRFFNSISFSLSGLTADVIKEVAIP